MRRAAEATQDGDVLESTGIADAGLVRLRQLSVLDFLDHDPRPTIVVDVSHGGANMKQLCMVATNASLRRNSRLMNKLGLTTIAGEAVAEDLLRFKAWASQACGSTLAKAAFFGHDWVSFTIEAGLRVISGHAAEEQQDELSCSTAHACSEAAAMISDPVTGDADNLNFQGASESKGNSLKKHHSQERGDPLLNALWSANQPPMHPSRTPLAPGLSDHAQFARTFDWKRTGLGPMETWSAELRTLFSLVMSNPHPALLYWGDDLIGIYNESYVPIISSKHPQHMGLSFKETWASFWADARADLQYVKMTGQSVERHDEQFFVDRSGFLEETYFSWTIIPVFDGSSSVAGMYIPIDEVTRRKVGERRVITLKGLSELIMATHNLPDFYAQALKGLEGNGCDIPFALIYSCEEPGDANGSAQGHVCGLRGTLGVPPAHDAAQTTLDIESSQAGFGPQIREAMRSPEPSYFSVERGTLDPSLVDGLNTRGYKDPCRAVVVIPVQDSATKSYMAFFIMGINSRRPYDEDHRYFFEILAKQINKWMQYTILSEEKLNRDQQAQIELSAQLAARTQEVQISETRFATVATYAPVGIFIADRDGHLKFFNEQWYELSGHPKNGRAAETWADYVHEEDLEPLTNTWLETIHKHVPTTMQFRFKKPWTAPDGTQSPTWVLGSSYPELGPERELKTIFGCLTNISEQKWAESLQTKRMEEALELKRQQEYFIDITSHEMRNPLSAILQCADAIIDSLTAYERQCDPSAQEILRGNLEAAQTISLCAQHQKRIVDDVLTLSKINSALLLVTPVDVEPLEVVKKTMGIYKREVESKRIAMELHVLDSYRDLDITLVKLDPSRLQQILINLITNAIKFIDSGDTRAVIVSVGATLECPSEQSGNTFEYFPTRSNHVDLAQQPDLETEDVVYLLFSVKDTGPGMSETEKKLLFNRFSQVSPRTHVQYGGSGLGLFISRELTELQHGEIGVESETGKGSTFAFYLKTRRSSQAAAGEAVDDAASMASNGQSAFDGNPSPPACASAIDDRAKADEQLSVLLVEDNLVNQRVLEKQLKHHGLAVHVANHGGDALRDLPKFNVWRGKESDGLPLSVMLMDIEMPVMDGLVCARRIRELQQEQYIVRHVPILAVTGNARKEHVKAAMDAGMVGYAVVLVERVIHLGIR